MDNPVRDKLPVSGLLKRLAEEVMGWKYIEPFEFKPPQYLTRDNKFVMWSNEWHPLIDLNQAWPLLAKVGGRLGDSTLSVMKDGLRHYESHNGPSDIPSVCRAVVRAVSLAKGFISEEQEIVWDE